MATVGRPAGPPRRRPDLAAEPDRRRGHDTRRAHPSPTGSAPTALARAEPSACDPVVRGGSRLTGPASALAVPVRGLLRGRLRGWATTRTSHGARRPRRHPRDQRRRPGSRSAWGSFYTAAMLAGRKGHNEQVRARVIVLAGPSGAGKSRLAERLGLPVLRLDDFYKNGDDPTLPRITEGANAGLVDWDHPDSWLPEDALATIERLCTRRQRRGAGLRDRPRRPLRQPGPRPGQQPTLPGRGHLRPGDRARVSGPRPPRGGVLRPPAPASSRSGGG